MNRQYNAGQNGAPSAPKGILIFVPIKNYHYHTDA
jgi:hypothetical protein